MLKHFELLSFSGAPETGLIRAADAKHRRQAHDIVRLARKRAQETVESAAGQAREASQQAYIEGFAVGLEQSLTVCAMQMADEHAVLAGLRHAMREQLSQWLVDTLREPALAALIEREVVGDAEPGPSDILRIGVPQPLQALGERLLERLRARGFNAQAAPSADPERLLVSWGERVWTLALRATARDWAEQCLSERGAPLKADHAARQLAARAAQRLQASLDSLAATGRAPRVPPAAPPAPEASQPAAQALAPAAASPSITTAGNPNPEGQTS